MTWPVMVVSRSEYGDVKSPLQNEDADWTPVLRKARV